MLPLPYKFYNSYNSKVGSAYPIVVIRIGQYENDWIYLSRRKKKMLVKEAQYENTNLVEEAVFAWTQDRGVQVSNISEKVDFSSRKFSTNKITVSLSNYSAKQTRFTEEFPNTEFTGLMVDVYYANEACDENLADCPLIFKGYIRDYKANQKKVSFDIEDYSQYIMEERTLPKRSVSDPTAETIDGNSLAPFPMVYGTNERSRLLFSRPLMNNLISKIYADATDSGIEILGFYDVPDPLKIFRDKMYLDVPEYFQEVPENFLINGFNYHDYYANNTKQYELVGGTDWGDSILLEKLISDHAFTKGMPLNIVAREQFQIDAKRTPSGVRASSTDQILNYGAFVNPENEDAEVTVEYQGHLNGYNVLSEGSMVTFPAPETQSLIYAGYYENLLTTHIYRRLHEAPDGLMNWNNDIWREDTGTFWLINYYLQIGENYNWGAGVTGGVDFYKTIPYPNSIIQYLSLPGGYDTASWIEYDVHGYPIPGDEDDDDSVDTQPYPFMGTYDGILDLQWDNRANVPIGNAASYGRHENVHPVLFWERPETVYNGGLYPTHNLNYRRIHGIKFHKEGSSDIKILWDDPINWAEESIRMENYWNNTSENTHPGAGFSIPSDILNTHNCADYLIPNSMDWLADGETPTLRKLLYGRRVEAEETTSLGVPAGSWVYGILPILGFSKPKTQTFTSNSDSTGQWKNYNIVWDSLYAYGNPMWHGVDGEDTWDGSGDYPTVDKLNVIEVTATPDEDRDFYDGFYPGLHYNYGSDFGTIMLNLYKQDPSQILHQIQRHPRVEYRGSDAMIGGDYATIEYTQGLIKAVKLDVTFNSISGNDVVQGGCYSRIRAKIENDLYFSHIDNQDEALDFLVECDAFKPYGGMNNVIELKDVQDLNTSEIQENPFETDENGEMVANDDYGEPTNPYKISTGHPGGETNEYQHSTSTDIDIEVDIDGFNTGTVLSDCDVDSFTEEEFEDDPSLRDTWRENINSINSVSFTYYIGKDLEEDDFVHLPNSEGGHPTDDYEPQDAVAQTIVGGLSTRLMNLELQQRFIVGNVSQLDYYANVKGRIDYGEFDANLIGDSDYADYDAPVRGKYTGEVLDGGNINESWLIQSPPDILLHMMDKELDYSFSSANTDSNSLNVARINHSGWKFDFTIFEENQSRKFIEDFSKSSLFVPRVRHDGTFSFINMLQNYTESDLVIDSNDVMSFNYSKTSRGDLYLKVKVNYDWDDGLGEYNKSTNAGNGGAVPDYYLDENGNQQSGWLDLMSMYKVNKIDDAYLEVGSKFIKNGDTAKALRNHLLSFHKNRHNIIECRLPHKYIHLECGDVVEFDTLIQGVTMFGKDYTSSYMLAGQMILPFFVVKSVKKSTQGVDLSLMQLHEYDSNILEEDPNIYDFTIDVGEDDEADFEPPPPVGYCTIYGEDEDVIHPELMTEQECIDLATPDGFWDWAEESTVYFGDLNEDGAIDVLDIVTIVNMIMNPELEYSPAQLFIADVNQDGAINVLDIVSMINTIIGD